MGGAGTIGSVSVSITESDGGVDSDCESGKRGRFRGVVSPGRTLGVRMGAWGEAGGRGSCEAGTVGCVFSGDGVGGEGAVGMGDGGRGYGIGGQCGGKRG